LLLAIADQAGGEWPEKAREAALTLAKVGTDSLSIGVRLLADIKAIFEEQAKEKLFSGELVTHLGAMEDRAWSEYGKSSKPITPNKLARLLSGFSICPATIRVGELTAKGYQRSQFTDAFERYLRE
jgi:hypothetical protein